MSAQLYQGALVYAQGRLTRADVLVRDGVIEAVGAGLDAAFAERIDCAGVVLSPGFIDLHTHLREPGFSAKETIRTGTMAAAAGGFATVCAMPNLNPVPDTAEALRWQLSMIDRDAAVEVLPYGAITRGQAGQALASLEAMAAHCAGFSDDGKGVQSAALMKEAMLRVRALYSFIAAHCEDEAYPPKDARSEWKQLERDLSLVAETGVRYHVCHVSAKESVSLIRQAKADGLPVTCECTPHQLMLCAEDIVEDDGRFKMNPPLRDRADRDAIVEGLLDGTIDCIATDHAPHTDAEKAGGFQRALNGVVGLETAFAVCHTALVQSGLCSLPLLLEKLVDAPARVLSRPVSRIAPGQAATFARIDPACEWEVRPERFLSLGRSSPFAGMRLTGRIVGLTVKGENR